MWTKRVQLNFLLKISDLKLDFTQTLCYPSFEQPSPGKYVKSPLPETCFELLVAYQHGYNTTEGTFYKVIYIVAERNVLKQ